MTEFTVSKRNSKQDKFHLFLYSLYNLIADSVPVTSPARRSVKNFTPHAERMSPDYARLIGKLLLSIFKVQKYHFN